MHVARWWTGTLNPFLPFTVFSSSNVMTVSVQSFVSYLYATGEELVLEIQWHVIHSTVSIPISISNHLYVCM
jgi:hypothetical protein